MTTYPKGMSFIIPAFNESANIVNCIQSIKKEIKRRPDIPCEIIVIDNNSTDDTAKKAYDCGDVCVLSEKQKGVVRARQTGYLFASYQFLANIDCDNILPEGWLDVAWKIATTSNCAAFSGPLVYYDVGLGIKTGNAAFYLVARMLHKIWPTLQGGNYVIRKDVLDAMGGYDTTYEFYGEDTNTAVQASKHGKVWLVPNLWIFSSPRRIKHQGLFSTIFKYVINYFSVSIIGRNVSRSYQDYRE